MNLSNRDIPKLALGTWLMGGTKEPDPRNDDKKDIGVIQLAIDEGITLIDTAQNYASGKCEEIVGQAIKKYPRESYQILTKQNKDYLRYDDVIDDCLTSMKRMEIDYIDYFVCHAPNSEFNMHDFFKAANKLYQQGSIRNVGVSNFGPKMLKIALDSSDIPIRFNQVHFSIDDDDIITTGTYDFCLKNNIKIQAYRSLVGIEGNNEAQTVLDSIAQSYKISIHQVVIAYLNSYKNVIFTIRASSKKHWDEIKQAIDITLNEEDIQEIYKLHQNKQGNFREFLVM